MKKSMKLLALIFTLFLFLFHLPKIDDSFLEASILESVLSIIQIKSFLDEEEKRKVFNSHVFYNALLEKLFKEIKTRGGGFFKLDQIKMFLVIRSFLFSFSGIPLDKELSIEELQRLKNCIMDLLFDYKNQGFLNTLLLERNKIYNLYRSLFLDENIFSNPNSNSFRELEFFQSLIILILVLEYELYIKNHEQKLDSLKKLRMETRECKEILLDLKMVKRGLIQNLNKSIRQILTGGRLYILDRIYTGFDTEYQAESDMVNTLLAYTTSSYSRVYLCIKPFRIEISDDRPPKSNELVLEVVKMIRLVTNKQDLEIERFMSHITNYPKFKKLSTKNFIAFTLDSNEQDIARSIKNSYFDLELDSGSYSFKNLVEKSLLDQTEIVFKSNQEIINILKNYKIPRIPVKKELYLIAHFTTADICSLSDFQEIKNKFSILRKSFVSLDRTMRVGGWKIILRDTSLLSPTGASLSSIGNLYTKEFKKLEVPKIFKLDMKKLKDKDIEFFKSYAIQDSKITL